MFDPKRQWPLLTGGIAFLSLLFVVVVMGDFVPLVRGPEAWRWWLLPLPSMGKILLTAGAVLLFVLGWWGLGRLITAEQTRKRVWGSLFALAILAFIVQIALLSIYRTNPFSILFERLVSDQASGYFTVAAEIDHLPTFLKAYPELMPQFRPDPHPRSKPPGIVLLYWGATRILEKLPSIAGPIGHWARNIRCADLWLVSQSDAALAGVMVVGVLTIIVSILAIWPAYGLAARRWGAGAGWLAAGLMALLPGRLIFAPHLDVVYPLLALLALYLVDTAVRRERLWLTAVAGVVLSIATFFSLVNVIAVAVIGIYLLAVYLPERRWKIFIQQGMALTAGVLSVWIVYWLYARVTPFDIYVAARPARHDLERNYWLWLVGNIYDFAVFVGLPIFLSAVFWTVAQLRRRMVLPLTLAFWSVFLLLDISGIIRAEVGRIWLMLAPFPVVLAAQWKIRQREQAESSGFRPGSQLVLLALTALCLWTMSLRWEVTRLEWPEPVERVVETTLPERPLVNIPFGPEIDLAAYEVRQGEQLVTTLFWQSSSRPDIAYTVFVHVLNGDDSIAVQRDTMPQNGQLPMTCWQEGEVVEDEHVLDISSLTPGSYRIVVGVYDQQTATRLGEVELEPQLNIE